MKKKIHYRKGDLLMERATGIEPASKAWKALILTIVLSSHNWC